jgi:HD-like signal output (HDOD) protein
MKNPLARKRKPKLGKSKGEEGYGDGRVTLDFGDDALLDEEQLVERLLACLEAPDYRPPMLPSVAADLMSLSHQPEVDFADVVRLLEQDSMIAGRILKVVQSPMYSSASKLTSLEDALVRLGIRTLRDLVLEISMNVRVFKSPDYGDTMDLLRRHSMTTAHLSKIVCNYTSIAGEYAFMAGLLHDAGIAGTLLALSDRKARGTKPPDLIAIWPAVDRVHQRAAELMAGHWSLPSEISMVMGAHHQVILDGQPHPLAATVCIADTIAHELGCGVIPKDDAVLTEMSELEKDCVRSHTSVDRSTPKTLEHAMTALQLTDVQLDLIREDGRQLLTRLNR